jgi:hypothetical protein
MFALSPYNSTELLIMFNKELDLKSLSNYRVASKNEILAKIARQLQLEGAGNLNIDENIAARVLSKSATGTTLAVTLTDEATIADIQNKRISIKDTTTGPDYGIDLTGIHTPAIFDTRGNAVAPGPAHALSDFAVNYVSTLYAFDNKDAQLGPVSFAQTDWAVRDFSGSGNNAGRISAGKDIFISSRINDDTIKDTRMVLSIAPPPESVSTNFNARTGKKSRLWLPTALDAIAVAANPENGGTTRHLNSDSSSAAPVINFRLPNDPDNPPANPSDLFNWKAPSQIQFLYELFDSSGNQIKIDHDADSTTPDVPLYAIRLADPKDLLSIDLWSLDLADIQQQRGGVTILNNVINSNVKEKTQIEVNLPSTGNLTVTVMTLDGNIVKYLKRGREEKGIHYYSWDGTNNGGSPVARGMYFVRVVGPEINETRKVMVVKE